MGEVERGFGGTNKSRFTVCAKRSASTGVSALTTPLVERLISSLLTSSGVQFGCCCRINAAAPATCGAIVRKKMRGQCSFHDNSGNTPTHQLPAMDVPVKEMNSLTELSLADTISTPGAKMSTQRPQFVPLLLLT